MPIESHRYTGTPTIRPLEPADLDSVLELSVAAWQPVFDSFANILGPSIFGHLYAPDGPTNQRESVRGVCSDENVDAFVVVAEDGGVGGFAALAYDTKASMGVVEMIAVRPDYQRRGYARVLMEFAIDRFQSRGLALVNVGTGGDPAHGPARALYEAVGFTGLPLMNYYMAI